MIFYSAMTSTARHNTPADERNSAILNDSVFMRACRRERVPYTPVWLMRQAGRYMPEYRDVRAKHSFLELCKNSALAAEVTVTAVERLNVDAAIIFADILLPLEPLGAGLEYIKGDGPCIRNPVRTTADLERLKPVEVEDSLGYVLEAIRLARGSLKTDIPLIGFAGAPFTLASYLIEGGASRNYEHTKTLMYNEPESWHRLMERLSAISADYLNAQIKAGVQAVQLFDSWVGCLNKQDYRDFVMPHVKSVIGSLGNSVPVIHFGTGNSHLLTSMREAGGDVIGVDWRVNIGEAWDEIGYDVAIQGNLDPVVLLAHPREIISRAHAIMDQTAGRPGHIFNLGHGVLQTTPVENAKALVEAVHQYRRAE
jgi:uroporphyrinogen decarboxylase